MRHLVSRGNETIECDVSATADGSIRVVMRNPDGRVDTLSLRGARATSVQWQRLVERLTGGRDGVSPKASSPGTV